MTAPRVRPSRSQLNDNLERSASNNFTSCATNSIRPFGVPSRSVTCADTLIVSNSAVSSTSKPTARSLPSRVSSAFCDSPSILKLRAKVAVPATCRPTKSDHAAREANCPAREPVTGPPFSGTIKPPVTLVSLNSTTISFNSISAVSIKAKFVAPRASPNLLSRSDMDICPWGFSTSRAASNCASRVPRSISSMASACKDICPDREGSVRVPPMSPSISSWPARDTFMISERSASRGTLSR